MSSFRPWVRSAPWRARERGRSNVEKIEDTTARVLARMDMARSAGYSCECASFNEPNISTVKIEEQLHVKTSIDRRFPFRPAG